MEFADGDTLTVEAVTRAVGSGGFEPWLLEGDYGYSAVSIAGGGLSVAQGPPNPGGLNPLSHVTLRISAPSGRSLPRLPAGATVVYDGPCS